ncbi:hemolysin family protein [Candidatus Xianfuyuplasma coldseepsis]|uniref:HlyC/CorC family transporter n=1 Tax=Candidatus Xianfuyuplasma coldseepsis TaxID=2782163 RepID=A0A7L7KST4_9MOLU|nr:hemolysin family protein [Xianfuyuplasma coldseepsis]QMS85665.1 HlyC/CorC family transporter [Xianfuyuplasma coldseepsis]
MDDYWQRYLLAFTDIPVGLLALMVGLLLMSAFFSLSETVFSSVNVIRLKTFIEDGIKGSKKGLWITENFDRTLTTILVGNNLANIALATVSVSLFTQIFGDPTVVNLMNTFVMTTIILIFGEIVPKSFAKNNAERLALVLSNIMYWLISIMSPITWIFLKIRGLLIKENDEITISVTGDELETIIDTMEEEGSIDEDEAEMLQSVLDLSEKTVYDIMTPRVDMIAIDVNEEVETIKKIFFDHQFSRLPVYDKSVDNIVGILHERDFFTKLIKDQKIYIRKLMKEAMFVSKSMRVDTLIELLQREKAHMAVVSGEYGGTSGVVTMEDALEELVGEIYDEHDEVDDEMISQIKEFKFGINADIDLEDLFEELDIGTPPETQYSNLGGWLYGMFEDLPEVDMHYNYLQEIPNYEHDDDEPSWLNLKFVIKEIRDRRITYVHLTVENVTKE